MSEIKPANERLSDYLKTLSPRLNQFAIAHIAETVLPQFQIEEAIELRAAYEALQKEKAALQECAAKGVTWFSILSQITVMLDLPDDKPIPSGAIEGVRNILDELEAQQKEVERLKAENEAQAKRIAELESEIGWINSLQGEDVMYETILARAKQSYIRHKYSVRGQILTRDDDLQTHIIHAAIEYAASKNGDSE